MGQDDDTNGCDHDWQLVELVPDKRPGEFVPTLSRVSQCTRCDAIDYDASRRPGRTPLGGTATT
jgi:hypothetical protein